MGRLAGHIYTCMMLFTLLLIRIGKALAMAGCLMGHGRSFRDLFGQRAAQCDIVRLDEKSKR